MARHFGTTSTNGIREKALRRPPMIKVSARQRMATMNQSALQFITRGGTGSDWVCLCRAADGSYYLEPIHVPKEAVSVRRIVQPPSQQGPPRVASGPMPAGEYDVTWDEEEGVIRLTRTNARSGKAS